MSIDWLDVVTNPNIPPGACLRALEKARAEQKSFLDPDKPIDIHIRTDEHVTINEAVRALARDRQIYQRGGLLCHVLSDPRTKIPRIVPVPKPLLRTRLTVTGRFLRHDPEADDWSPVHPPQWVVDGTASLGHWPGVRQLHAVTETPILARDGSVLSEPGYNAASGVLYQPGDDDKKYPIPEKPTREQAQAAAKKLLDVVRDFPFENPAHQSAWLAAVLTPLARYAFDGPVPLFLVDANIRGAGKGLLVDAVARITHGRDLARMSHTYDDNEVRKRVTAIALSGAPMVLIDNISGSLGSSSLDAAMTATSWNDRILGKSEESSVPLNAIWFGTGNNIILKGDFARRVCHIRLLSPDERPEDRSDFAHPQLRTHIDSHRPELVAAALTILRAYHLAGRPAQRIAHWGSYEGWSEAIRQPIVWLGLVDPAETRIQLSEESDEEGGLLRRLLAAWIEYVEPGEGMTCAEILRILESENLYATEAEKNFRSAVTDFVGGKSKISARSLGMRLKKFRQRICDQKSIHSTLNRQKTQVWYVEITQDAGTGSDDSSTPCTTPGTFDPVNKGYAGTAGTEGTISYLKEEII